MTAYTFCLLCVLQLILPQLLHLWCFYGRDAGKAYFLHNNERTNPILIVIHAVAINAVYMQFYISGVSCPYVCSRLLDHGVVLVGYSSAGYAPIRFKNKPYWIIKNSWGENWGDNGYYKICKGHNICGVESEVSTVTVTTTAHRP